MIYSLAGTRDFRFPQYHRTESANLRVQMRLIEIFARIPDVQFLVKLYVGNPKASPIARVIEEKALPNVKAIVSPPLSALLGAADAFIIDHPSTSLSEMALTDRPIYFIDALSWLDWLPEAREAVRRRCAYFEDLDAAETAMRRDFSEKEFPTVSDHGYLLDYGLCEEDGQT